MFFRFVFLCFLCVENAFGAGEDGAELMRQLQNRLLAAKRIAVEADIQSRGTMFTTLKGSALLGERNTLTLSYGGQFGDRPAVLVLTADYRSQELRSGGNSRREAMPGETNRAVLIGLLRMGLLHNLTRLSRLEAPDHAAGGVEQWVTLDNFRPTTYILGGELEGTLSFGFDVLLRGEHSASARLWLDPASGLPRRREQTVKLPGGETKVIESYTRFTLE